MTILIFNDTKREIFAFSENDFNVILSINLTVSSIAVIVTVRN